VPDLLLEAEDYSTEARAYRDAAHQRALWAAWALALQGQPMDLAQIRRLLDREALLRALEPHRGRDPRIGEWLQRLDHQRGGIEDSGARGLDRALGVLLDGVAMRGSLRNCPEALRLEDVLDTCGLVLFSLDVADYPHATRKVASWVLLGMGRLARQLPQTGGTRALLLVDEVGALGNQARHLRGLVGRAREAGLAVVLATQGPSDLEAVDRALLPQVLQDTAWQLAFRQGSPQDAERMQALFGHAYVEDLTRYSDGRFSTRHVERPRVAIDEWMNALEPGDAWLRVAPIDHGWRQERVRVALPSRSMSSVITSVNDSVTMSDTLRPALTESAERVPGGAAAVSDIPPRTPSALPAVPPDCPQELVEKMGADILAKVERRWPKRRHELGPCLVWTGPKGPDAETGPYGRMYDAAIGKTDYVHRIVWRRAYGPIPAGLDVDHQCNVALCQRPDHLQLLLTKPQNTRRRGPTRGRMMADSTEPEAPGAVQRFAVALFEGVDRTAVEARSLSLDELRQMLSRFEVLEDKRRGRCWSPTEYAPGHTSRGNAGVAAVSALVFDCDRVPPDPERLAGVYWIGHTTWSHTPTAPRWRVVIPLTTPVPSAAWRDVWQRARTALCPEADPSCKDPSRAYWLPSHSGGVAAKTTCHDGPLLDASTLPALPAEPARPELQRSPSAKVLRRATDSDRRRGEAYMDRVIAGLESTAPGGRNDALNHRRGRWADGSRLARSRRATSKTSCTPPQSATVWSATMVIASAGPQFAAV
jgi:hypothetical protein